MSPDLFNTLVLPQSGRIIPNRLVKVAMYEHLASFLGGPPNQYHYNLYDLWSRNGPWGMIITGNVQVSATHLSLGRDLLVPKDLSDDSVQPFTKLASIIHESPGTLAIMQLNHSGRQSSNIIGGRLPFISPMAPSAVRLSSGQSTNPISTIFNYLAFQKPRPMSLVDIDRVVNEFVRGARLAYLAGFDGIQLHVAHGYLLAQFISVKSNIRKDQYSSEKMENCLRLLGRIVASIREVVPSTFVVGIKFNVADYIDTEQAQPTDERALAHIRHIGTWSSVDFLEISGGDYSHPEFMTANSSNSPRQAFFARFSRLAVKTFTDEPSRPVILLTGGLRTPAILRDVLQSRDADLLGIGRGSIFRPDLPHALKHQKLDDQSPFGQEPNLSLPSWIAMGPKISLIGAGVSMAWFIVRIRYLATVRSFHTRPDLFQPQYSVSAIGAIIRMWLWMDRSSLYLAILMFVLVSVLLTTRAIFPL
ncbi:hypothetical protein C8J56DRAFT_544282 [Mycena floridula]|nr:hypothetical protein C8J56DRAFT_544282 [Mycena floridula]